jgi:alpha-L-fucosidase 2
VPSGLPSVFRVIFLLSIISLLIFGASLSARMQTERSSQLLALESWQAVRSPYRMVDDRGFDRHLVKATINFVEPTPLGWSLVLRDPEGGILDEEGIPPRRKGDWAHGFWLPSTAAAHQTFSLELRNTGKVIEKRSVTISSGSEKMMELPLRIDRLNDVLLRRLETREAPAVAAESTDVAAYLRQHDIIYRQPSPEWDEGLPLGNGDVGTLVTGVEGKEQTFYLDKTDIWLATAEGKPLGRSYAGVLRIRHSQGSGSSPFLQRLSLGQAEVITQDGSFRSTARVHALQNRLEVEVTPAEVEIVVERRPVPLTLAGRQLITGSEQERNSRLYGSDAVKNALHTQVDWGVRANQCWFVHTAPNLGYAVVITVADAEVNWKQMEHGYLGQIRPVGNRSIRLLATLATNREHPDPLAQASQLVKGMEREAHLQWWHRFWSRSWIELTDKLEENLWYIGLYLQGACSRSDQAVSFFGLWHPRELRTWYDGYITDAQVEMMWWQCFATNHLELLYPSHRTFGRLAAEFLKYRAGPGLVVPHLFTPEWAGGQEWFTEDSGYKGSSAWYTMNFWWDYLYSGDREFLRDVTYPLLRMVADFNSADLVREADGRYHCLNSWSPEQNNTRRDNTYDWAMLTYLFRTAIRASEILGVDAEARPRWREILEHLFPYPGDGQTLWETYNLPHPYRCHPVVLFGLYPTMAITHGSPLFESTRRTLPKVTRVVGFRGPNPDRNDPIPGFEGGVEPNGFASGIITTAAARLGDHEQYRRFLYGLIVRFNLKQSGLRAIWDPRQAKDVLRAPIMEAANADTVAITETLLQTWDDHIRLFPCIGDKGRYRFSGLRAGGGFIISAEADNGRLLWAQVKSLHDGTLHLASPGFRTVLVREHETGNSSPFNWLQTKEGEQRLELKCRAGVVYDILADQKTTVDLKLVPGEPRQEPRTISIASAENQGEPLIHYPEDLPFGQIVKDQNLYLGRPSKYGSPRLAPEVKTLLANTLSPSWQERQEAARLMARTQPTGEVLAALDRLCSDQVTVVAHTAAVTLIRLGTRDALLIARKHAVEDSVPGMWREVEKALQRNANLDEGKWDTPVLIRLPFG